VPNVAGCIVCAVCCQLGYSSDTVLTLDDLPSLYEFLIIESDSTLTVNEGETAIIEGVLTLQGTVDTTPELKIINNGELTAKNWLVKTSSAIANIVFYNDGNITFNVPFIENVSSSVLTSIGPEGQEFVESSGGTITVTNNGLVTEQNSTNDGFDLSLIFILAIVAVVIVVIVVFFMTKKKKQNKIFSKPDLQKSYSVFCIKQLLSSHKEGKASALQGRHLANYSRNAPLPCLCAYTFCIRFLFQSIFRAQFG